MIKAFANHLLQERWFERDESVVVGLSGGPDSMSLLHLLLEINRDYGFALKIHLAHLNHHLRAEESDADAAFVQAVADDLALPCFVESALVADSSHREGIGVEEAGRRARYLFLEKIAGQVGSRSVLAAHHYDDQAETILHRVLRGTGLRGLSGIPALRPIRPDSPVRLVRPLLRFRRKALLEYLQDHGIPYREDRSNASPEPTRNRIRLAVLPAIEEQINPQVKDALVRLGEQASWLTEYLRETVQRTFETLIIDRTDQELALNLDAMARKSRIVQTELVRLAYISFGLGEQELSFAHLVAVLDLLEDPASGRSVQLPQGMSVARHYHRLVFSLPSDQPRESIAEEIAIHVPGCTRLPIRQLEIECRIEECREQEIPSIRKMATRLEEFLSYEAVRLPLVVRRRRPGDRFWPLGAPGSKKLSEFLSDAKVEKTERDRVAVLCDQFGPIWLIGHRIDDRVKLTTRTRRVLHLITRPVKG